MIGYMEDWMDGWMDGWMVGYVVGKWMDVQCVNKSHIISEGNIKKM